MELTFVLPGEGFFPMKVDSYYSVHDIKQKLQRQKGFPAASLSLSHKGCVLDDEFGTPADYGIAEGSFVYVFVADEEQQQQQSRDGGASASLRLSVVIYYSGDERKCVEVTEKASSSVATLRPRLEVARQVCGFPLPGDGDYFFVIHGKKVVDEQLPFEWHGAVTGDEVEVFPGSVTGP